MKALLLSTLLAGSLAANAWFLSGERRSTSLASRPTSSTPPSFDNSRHAPPSDTDLWTALGCGDYSAVERLRAAGYPADALRIIVTELVNQRVRQREAALAGPPADFWSAAFSPRADPALRDRVLAAELDRERRAQLRALLGADYVPDVDSHAAGLPDVPPLVVEQVLLIDQKYAALRDRVQRGRGYNALMPDDRERLRTLAEQHEAELAALLTPEQRYERQLRLSSTAEGLRAELLAFDTTETEFRRLFEIRQAMEATHGPAYADRRDAKDQETAAVRQALGDVRFADYVRSKEQSYRHLVALGRTHNIPADRLKAAFDLSDAYGKEGPLDFAVEDRQKAVRKELASLLGPKAAEEYIRMNPELRSRLNAPAHRPPAAKP
jgi:hypothetical protein